MTVGPLIKYGQKTKLTCVKGARFSVRVAFT